MKESADKIKADVASFVEKSFSYEVYDVTFKPVNKKMVLEVFIDSPNGIRVSDCEAVSRKLSAWLDETNLITGSFTLNVSSPGVERVFKRLVDYERHLGKMVKWSLINGENGQKEVFRGRLEEFSPDKIVVRQEKGLREFKLKSVKEARAVFEFPARAQKQKARGGKNG